MIVRTAPLRLTAGRAVTTSASTAIAENPCSLSFGGEGP